MQVYEISNIIGSTAAINCIDYRSLDLSKLGFLTEKQTRLAAPVELIETVRHTFPLIKLLDSSPSRSELVKIRYMQLLKGNGKGKR